MTFENKIHCNGWCLLQQWIRLLLGCVLIMTKHGFADETSIKIKTTGRLEELTAVNHYRALLGSRIELPCDVTLPSADDSISLILWYKNDRKSPPVYNVDARSTPIDKAIHFASDTLRNRAKFDLSFRPAVLLIDPVLEDDAAIYLCRVDFKWARTIYTVNNLTVIVPPRQVIITDVAGNGLQDIIGPFDEGSNIRLICKAYGGIPPPSVHWFRDGALIDNSYKHQSLNETSSSSLSSSSSSSSSSLQTTIVSVNEIVLENLGRSDLFSVLMCQASNTNLSNHIFASVSLDINLKPLDVQIVSFKKSLVARKNTEVICQSRGSRPPATISWFLGTKQITNLSAESFSDDGNLTTSVLNFVPLPEHNGASLICQAGNSQKTTDSGSSLSSSSPSSQAEHKYLQGGKINEGRYFIKDQWKLNVEYPPKVSLILLSPKMERTSLSSSTSSSGPFGNNDQQISGSSHNNNNLHKDVESSSSNFPHYFSSSNNEPSDYPLMAREGDEVIIKCSVESNPAVTDIKWFFNKELLKSDPIKGLIISNSSLIIKVVTRHNAGKYKCKASNEYGIGESKERRLDVLYAPVCNSLSKKLDSSMRYSSIVTDAAQFRASEVGTNTKFETISSDLPVATIVYGSLSSSVITIKCQVDANPEDVSFYWTFNGTEITSIPVSKSDSRLMTPTTESAGPSAFYMGSNEMRNRQTSQKSLQRLKEDKSSVFRHQVDSGLQSVLHFKPSSVTDFGLLACWAKNKIGSQVEPCLFTLVLSNPPEPLESCVIANQTWDAIFVDCNSGSGSLEGPQAEYNSSSYALTVGRYKESSTSFHQDSSSSQRLPFPSSLPTTYCIEVYTNKKDRLLANISSQSPMFLVTGLTPSTAYEILVYSINSMGRSRPFRLTSETPMMLTRKQAANYFQTQHMMDSKILLIVLGISSLLLLFALIILIILKIRKRDEQVFSRNNKSARSMKSDYERQYTSSSVGLSSKSAKSSAPRTQIRSSNGGDQSAIDRANDILLQQVSSGDIQQQQQHQQQQGEGAEYQTVTRDANIKGTRNPDVIPTKQDFTGVTSSRLPHPGLMNSFTPPLRFSPTPSYGSTTHSMAPQTPSKTLKITSMKYECIAPHVTIVDTGPHSMTTNNAFPVESFEEPNILALSTAV